MKVSVDCRSLLLQKSLENFLKRHIVSKKSADFIISDHEAEVEKPLFLLGREVEKPFSRSRLFMELEKYEKKLRDVAAVKEVSETAPVIDDATLEARIEALTRDFVSDVVNIVKEHYGKA